jgi:hypothetical protein
MGISPVVCAPDTSVAGFHWPRISSTTAKLLLHQRSIR